MALADEPYLRYLTVFRSRLGVLNLLLAASSVARQPEQAFKRRIRQVIDRRVDVSLSDPSSLHVLEYLADKKLVSPKPKDSGRYRGWSLRPNASTWEADFNGKGFPTISVYQTDIWLADPRVPSTIGAPTAENADEIVDLGFQFRVIDRNKYSWSTSGQLISVLHTAGSDDDPGNPFVLRTESPVLLRSLLEVDGRFQLPLLQFLAQRGAGATVKRDDVAEAMPLLALQALDDSVSPKLSRAAVLAGRETLKALEGAPGGSSGPGVREHRSSPRLEWLTDLGYLSKASLPRNAFEYVITDQLIALSESLTEARDKSDDWSYVTALRAWRSNSNWAALRKSFTCDDPRSAFGTAYKLLRRPIGPVPIRDVGFVTGMLCASWQPEEITENIVELVRNISGGSLAGGRYNRSPESVYLPESSLRGFD